MLIRPSYFLALSFKSTLLKSIQSFLTFSILTYIQNTANHRPQHINQRGNENALAYDPGYSRTSAAPYGQAVKETKVSIYKNL